MWGPETSESWWDDKSEAPFLKRNRYQPAAKIVIPSSSTYSCNSDHNLASGKALYKELAKTVEVERMRGKGSPNELRREDNTAVSYLTVAMVRIGRMRTCSTTDEIGRLLG